MKLLIVDDNAEYYQQAILKEFPDLEVTAAKNESAAEPYIEEAEAFMAILATNNFISKATSLRWIQSLISGTDFFTQLVSLPENVLITSSRGIHGPQMSEITLLLMLALNRRFKENLRNQEQKIWQRWPSRTLFKKSVGILGVGVIGTEVARKCKSFGMTVHGLTSSKRKLEAVDYSYGPEEMETLFSKVDYLVNILPNTPDTKKVIGKEHFAAMKPDAYFINVGRGDTVDEEALIDVLEAGKIAGAGLDVFTEEPLPETSPIWDLDNVIILPHVGGTSDIYPDLVLPNILENIGRYLKGERNGLINVVQRVN